jgi:hypothetical protein
MYKLKLLTFTNNLIREEVTSVLGKPSES